MERHKDYKIVCTSENRAKNLLEQIVAYSGKFGYNLASETANKRSANFMC